MAGIIARITRSNRERLEKKQAEVNINKSIYDIRPFDDRFVPQKHNHYTVCREYYAETFEAMEFYDFVTKRLQELQKEEESSRAFTWCTFIFEAILLVLSIVTVPSLMVFLYLTWPVQIDK